mgnify:CR=1 FL=1
MNEGEIFQYTDMHQDFMKRNGKVLSLSKLLIAYSLIGLILTCFGLFGNFMVCHSPAYPRNQHSQDSWSNIPTNRAVAE